MGVLDEVAEGGAEAGGDEVGGVAEEDCCFGCGVCGGAPGSLGGEVSWEEGVGVVWAR